MSRLSRLLLLVAALPCAGAQAQLFHDGWADAETLATWRSEAVRRIEEAVAQAQREPAPDPYKEDWCALASKHLSDSK